MHLILKIRYMISLNGIKLEKYLGMRYGDCFSDNLPIIWNYLKMALKRQLLWEIEGKNNFCIMKN